MVFLVKHWNSLMTTCLQMSSQFILWELRLIRLGGNLRSWNSVVAFVVFLKKCVNGVELTTFSKAT